MSAKIRKTSVIVEETRRDIGKAVNPPTRKAAALAVIERIRLPENTKKT